MLDVSGRSPYGRPDRLSVILLRAKLEASFPSLDISTLLTNYIYWNCKYGRLLTLTANAYLLVEPSPAESSSCRHSQRPEEGTANV
jgi:hypothetical protein